MARGTLELTWPRKRSSCWLASPPLAAQPLAVSQLVRPSSTSTAGLGENTSTTVVRSLLAARRKNTSPMASSRVSSRVEPELAMGGILPVVWLVGRLSRWGIPWLVPHGCRLNPQQPACPLTLCRV